MNGSDDAANRPAAVEIRSERMVRDLVFLVTGGTAHIGAAATATWTEDGRVRTDVIALPGHREGELAAELATIAARSLGVTVAVLAGIHLDRTSKREIEQVLDRTRERWVRMLEQWERQEKEKSEDAEPLLDKDGRAHDNLRISVTDYGNGFRRSGECRRSAADRHLTDG